MLNKSDINEILNIAKDAGAKIMQYFDADFRIDKKGDNSPVTKADIEANNIIIEKLSKLFPDIPIISEENKKEENIIAMEQNKFFVVDPLDGTSSFIKKSDEFTVNIALIEDKKPVFGVIYLPAKDLLYYTDINDCAKKIEKFSKKDRQSENIKVSKGRKKYRIICTKREPERTQIIEQLKTDKIAIDEVLLVSSSYKFCLIAEGEADLYPRKAKIKIWDIAAGHAIVKAAKGYMVNSKTGEEINYNFNNNFEVPYFEVCGEKKIQNKEIGNLNLSDEKSSVKYEDRILRSGHKGAVFWLTGFSGAGKSSISQRTQKMLFEQNKLVYVLDGDNIRKKLNRDLGFDKEGRSENIRRIAEVASILSDAGFIVIASFISPYEEDRKKAAQIIGKKMHLIYIKADLNICIKRDIKGHYKKALLGDIKNFTGIDDKYEEPKKPQLIIDTDKNKDLEECSNIFLSYIKKHI